MSSRPQLGDPGKAQHQLTESTIKYTKFSQILTHYVCFESWLLVVTLDPREDLKIKFDTPNNE